MTRVDGCARMGGCAHAHARVGVGDAGGRLVSIWVEVSMGRE